MNKDLTARISSLEQKLGYKFKNKNYLINALSHSSYDNEHFTKYGSNERLEFLGDSVLSLVTAEYLYGLSDRDEGYLTKVKAKAVCESSLFDFAQTLNLGEYMFFGKGEASAGKIRPSTISDCFEAVVAAIYLDGGYDKARDFILPFLENVVHHSNSFFTDYKTLLQEIVQKNKEEKLSYQIVDERGPDHDKTFVCHVLLNSNIVAKGEGHSKKMAEQQAAKEALALMGIKDEP